MREYKVTILWDSWGGFVKMTFTERGLSKEGVLAKYRSEELQYMHMNFRKPVRISVIEIKGK